LYIIQK